MMDSEHIRKVVREELQAARQEWNSELYNQLAPFRIAINRLVRDIYAENPDGSRADGGGLLDMTKRNNTLLWVVLVLSLVNFVVMVVFILLIAANWTP